MAPPQPPRIRTNRFGIISAALLALVLIGFTLYFVSIPSRTPPEEPQSTARP
ncbi:hypothetical protein AFFFEF_04328 [Methylorubrum extorquens]